MAGAQWASACWSGAVRASLRSGAGAGAGEMRGSDHNPPRQHLRSLGQAAAIRDGAMWFQQTMAHENKASRRQSTIGTLPRSPSLRPCPLKSKSDGLASVLRSQDEEPGQRAPVQRAEPPKRSCVSGDLT